MTPDPKPPKRDTGESRNTPSANWRELAQATASEQDPTKVVQRAQELIRALDAESQERMEHSPVDKHRDKAAS
ncbi:MAG TPA: hypothetical protein VN682_26295 [Terriglobales bacterium]|jgi:hypothetical protein|nr:hypothetical protein [Terriglobales bacterium]